MKHSETAASIYSDIQDLSSRINTLEYKIKKSASQNVIDSFNKIRKSLYKLLGDQWELYDILCTEEQKAN